MQFYTISDIGNTRALTPEGFLLCQAVPIARTGMQLYGPGETPIEPGPDGMVYIDRDPEEVFRLETIASFAGKPVVNEHPLDALGLRCDVTLVNWRDLVVGVALNPRRGDRLDEDVLIADLMITDRNAIELIDAGKVQVSCGYSADYEETGPGRGRQIGIVGNHIALVDQGRCGARCAIGDEQAEAPCSGKWGGTNLCVGEIPPVVVRKETGMLSLRELLRRARGAKTDQEFDALLLDADQLNGSTALSPPGSTVHVHVGGRTRDAGEGEEKDDDKDDKEDKNGTGDQAVAELMGRHDQELEELWQANEAERAVIERLAGGADAKFRDGFPHRDARRTRMGIRHNRDEDMPAAPNPTESGTEVLPEFEIEAPPGTADRLRRARDSALFADSFQETIAIAEILMPGLKLPVYDRTAAPKATFDQLCQLRGRVLDQACANPEIRELIDELTGGTFPGNTRGMRCERVRDVFFAAGAMKRRQNMAATGRQGGAADMLSGGGVPVAGVGSLGDLNRLHSEYYAAQRR